MQVAQREDDFRRIELHSPFTEASSRGEVEVQVSTRMVVEHHIELVFRLKRGLQTYYKRMTYVFKHVSLGASMCHLPFFFQLLLLEHLHGIHTVRLVALHQNHFPKASLPQDTQ